MQHSKCQTAAFICNTCTCAAQQLHAGLLLQNHHKHATVTTYLCPSHTVCPSLLSFCRPEPACQAVRAGAAEAGHQARGCGGHTGLEHHQVCSKQRDLL
jgi:hypothetical protein